MKIHITSLLLCLMLLSMAGCNSAPTTNTSSQPAPGEGTPHNVAPDAKDNPATPDTHQCLLNGTILEDNNFWIKSAQTLVGIVADSTTKDSDFGDSHRIFIAMNTNDCSTILRETLPVNSSPDFPWYLNTNTYEQNNQILCMQGMEFVYCYDVVENKLLDRMTPAFRNKRIAEDAQSGTPAGLDIWNHYLLAYALDQGAYAFDLRDKENIKVVLPNAEFYSNNDGSYHSLFLLEDENGMVQAMMPSLNEDQDGMVSNKMFKKPQPLNTMISASVRDNRFIVLSSKDGQSKRAIDMEKMRTVDLPAEVAAKNMKEILDYLKK